MATWKVGVDRSLVHSVKILSQRPGRESVGVILHVVSSDAAEFILEHLAGEEVVIRGHPRPLKVRLADSAQELADRAPPIRPRTSSFEWQITLERVRMTAIPTAIGVPAAPRSSVFGDSTHAWRLGWT